MKKQEQLELTELLRREFVKNAIEITNSLDNLEKTLDNSIKSILQKMQNKIVNKQFDIDEYTKSVTKVDEIKDGINTLKFLLTCTDEEKNKWKIDNIQSLAAFKVDPTIEHTLNESFQYKNPYGFSLAGGTLIRTTNWKDLFLKICEHFIILDEKLFISFEDKKHMNGKKTKYFSKNPDNIINPISINNKIYIKSMKDTGVIKKIIINMLDEYGYKIDDFILYLDSDFTELNN